MSLFYAIIATNKCEVLGEYSARNGNFKEYAIAIIGKIPKDVEKRHAFNHNKYVCITSFIFHSFKISFF